MSQAKSGDSRLRASDADRERIVEKLRKSAAEGRLTMDEFEQRMSAAYAAKTYGDLAALTADLPVDLREHRSGGSDSSGGTGRRGEPQDEVPPGFRSDDLRSGAGAGVGSGYGPHPVFGGRTLHSERSPIDTASDIIGALVNAGADFHAQREIRRTNQQVKMDLRRQRHEMRMARRRGGPGGALGGWVVISAVLTGIWFLQLVTDPHGSNDFWPAWPIGILGILALLRSIRLFGNRRY